jgi:hypothetical protein
VTNDEEEVAVAVAEGRANPKQPAARYAEVSNAIQLGKNSLAAFLATEYEPGDYVEKALLFLGRIGHLIGYNVPLQSVHLAELQDEDVFANHADAEAANPDPLLGFEMSDDDE